MRFYHQKSFYNPKAQLSRELGVVSFIASESENLFEVFAGGGSRTVMYSIFARPTEMYSNEASRSALCELKANIIINGIKNVKLFNEDIFKLSSVLYLEGKRFDFIDLDPFGSPSPYLPYIFLTVKEGTYIYITSTDMPTLAGKRKAYGFKLYGTYIPYMPFYPEVGLRALLYKLQSVAMEFSYTIDPLFFLYEGYAYRLLIRVGRFKGYPPLGFIYRCPNCGNYGVSKEPKGRCELCGSENESSGNIWIGRLKSQGFLTKMLDIAEELGFEKAKDFIKRALSEEDFPLYCELRSLHLRMMPRVSYVIKKLRERGFKSSRTMFSPTGIKTDAPFEEIMKVLTQSTDPSL